MLMILSASQEGLKQGRTRGTVEMTRSTQSGECDGGHASSDEDDQCTLYVNDDTFRNNVPDVRVFQTTSPAKSRLKEWTKQCDVDLYMMNLPSIEEVEDVA